MLKTVLSASSAGETQGKSDVWESAASFFLFFFFKHKTASLNIPLPTQGYIV